MNTTAPYSTDSNGLDRAVVLAALTPASAGRRVGLADRLLMRIGLAMMLAGRSHATAQRVQREPRTGFGPHRGAEVSRPFC